MPCFTTTSTWATDLKIGLESKQYVVQLKRQVGCCREDYQIFVNGKELQDHGLTFTPCGPLCSSGGTYEWVHEGHHFHIMDESLSWRKIDRRFRLFVDGIDVDTGLEFAAFWRRRGIQLVVLGSVFIFLAALVYILVFAVFKVHTKYLGSMSGANVLFCFGVAFIITAVIVFKKYSQPKSYPSSSSWSNVDYQSFRNV
ncbi:uncharacterized protein LOC116296576 [Actinia tenebrosa]|uniref:Uncharacterized protein LOC116296576 n=1 Tax=Actinia tenebrosa TaxID=6105 RepID=A0A6P8I6X0_ACTTE|nr:uncharacterized protein LOC116296576 [Actinia tenebrosa]